MIDAVGRPAGDILSRTVRLTFGDREFTLPVLTIAGNRRWLAELDREMAGVLDALVKSKGSEPTLLEVLAGQTDRMLDLLYAYDTSNRLPPREELLEIAYEDNLIAAVQEVWRAANPLVGIALARMKREAARAMVESSELTSTPPPSGAGRRRRSKTN